VKKLFLLTAIILPHATFCMLRQSNRQSNTRKALKEHPEICKTHEKTQRLRLQIEKKSREIKKLRQELRKRGR